jgi:cobalt/nickel transport system permease protein
VRVVEHREQLRSLGRNHQALPPLGRLDPRTNVLVTALFVVVLATFRQTDILGLLPLTAYLAAGLILSETSARSLRKYLLVTSPFALTLAVTLPLFDSRPATLLGLGVSSGWLAAAALCLRFVMATTAVLVLVSSNGFDGTVTALRRLGLPAVLVGQLALMHRYLDVLMHEAEQMLIAHRLRAPGRSLPAAATVPPMLSQWLIRSLERAERIHHAMLCRGFCGALPASTSTSMRLTDLCYLAGWAAFFCICRVVSVVEELGHWIVGWLA